MNNTLLVYSGGLDSSSALYKYNFDIAVAISFNYGSKHNEQEIAKAQQNCHKLGITHKVIDLYPAFKYIKSSLTDSNKPIPHGHYESKTMKETVVPFRNGIMLSIAAGLADSMGLKKVMLASHKGDHAVYPDCTPGFNLGMSEAISKGTENNITLWTPFEHLDKREIAKLGLEAGLKPEDTYSCYEGNETHCGKCSTCVERQWSLYGMNDETVYKDNTYWKEVMNVK